MTTRFDVGEVREGERGRELTEPIRPAAAMERLDCRKAVLNIVVRVQKDF